MQKETDREAARRYARNYREKNRERVNATARAWRHANPDIVREATRRYRESHPESEAKRKRSHSDKYVSRQPGRVCPCGGVPQAKFGKPRCVACIEATALAAAARKKQRDKAQPAKPRVCGSCHDRPPKLPKGRLCAECRSVKRSAQNEDRRETEAARLRAKREDPKFRENERAAVRERMRRLRAGRRAALTS